MLLLCCVSCLRVSRGPIAGTERNPGGRQLRPSEPRALTLASVPVGSVLTRALASQEFPAPYLRNYVSRAITRVGP